ncbi:hypothetical protein N2152v2_009665 [Parachlorella kessleri]
MDVLERIGALLSQRDRVALVSSCKDLWLRPDVASSARLWGSLDLAVEPAAGPMRSRLQHNSRMSCMAAFMRRHVGGLRSVSLAYPPLGPLFPDVDTQSALRQPLQALDGSPLASLHLVSGYVPMRELDSALGRLTTLTHLTLTCCNWHELPAQLSMLQRLKHLDASCNKLGSWTPLAALTGVTKLSMTVCGFWQLIEPLSALTALASLDLSDNPYLGGAGPLAWQPLLCLAALTELSMPFCRLTRLPRQLSCLERLATLDLGNNGPFEMGGLQPLGPLTTLTRLDLRDCQLRQAPPVDAEAFPVYLLPLDVLETICAHLSRHDMASHMHCYMAFSSCCKALWLREDVLASPKLWGYLDLRGYHCHTPSASQSGHTYSTLQSVAAWVRRHRRGLRICHLFWWSVYSGWSPSNFPASLLPLMDALAGSALTSLCIRFPSEGALCEKLAQLLPRLPTLSHLSIRASQKQQPLPDQLSVLCGLRALYIHDFGAFSGGSWVPLLELTALTKLRMEQCKLEHLPGELTALEGLASLGIVDVEALGDASWRLLPRLQALTALKLKGCHLTALPPQLSALKRLAYLSVSGNGDLSNKEDISNSSQGVWAPLQHLTALTKLKLDHCDLRELPDALGSLCQLRKLTLSHNSLLGRNSDGLSR